MSATELERLQLEGVWNRDLVRAFVDDVQGYRRNLERRWRNDEQARTFRFDLDQELTEGLTYAVYGPKPSIEFLHAALDRNLVLLERVVRRDRAYGPEVPTIAAFLVLVAQGMSDYAQWEWQRSRGYRRFAAA